MCVVSGMAEWKKVALENFFRQYIRRSLEKEVLASGRNGGTISLAIAPVPPVFTRDWFCDEPTGALRPQKDTKGKQTLTLEYEDAVELDVVLGDYRKVPVFISDDETDGCYELVSGRPVTVTYTKDSCMLRFRYYMRRYNDNGLPIFG